VISSIPIGDLGGPADPSIAVDSLNGVHIVYYKTPYTQNLNYVTNTSGSWVTTTIASGNTGQYPSIAIDSADYVHISYSTVSGSGGLKYSSNLSGSWSSATMAMEAESSIAIDTNNKVYICFSEWVNSGRDYLLLVTNASGAWTTDTVDSTIGAGSYNSIAVDANNKVHISYYDRINGDLKYATNQQ
jgi:hypothetical protein